MRLMDFHFGGPVVEWRGPAPFYFVAIPEEDGADIKFAAKGMEYCGQVPVVARIGDTEIHDGAVPQGRQLPPPREGRGSQVRPDRGGSRRCGGVERRTPVEGRGVGVRSGADPAV
jgi:hypothetical protein